MRDSLRKAFPAVVLILVVVVVWRYWTDGRETEDVRVSVEGDTSDMLVRLHEENQRLVGVVSNLQVEVAELELRLAENALAGYANRGDDRPDSPVKSWPVEAVVDPARLQIVDVNREMLVAVVNGGLLAGMKPGMMFSVVRAEEVLAVIRVTEVREKIAGGLIEWDGKRAFPEPGDRLVLRTTQDG